MLDVEQFRAVSCNSLLQKLLKHFFFKKLEQARELLEPLPEHDGILGLAHRAGRGAVDVADLQHVTGGAELLERVHRPLLGGLRQTSAVESALAERDLAVARVRELEGKGGRKRERLKLRLRPRATAVEARAAAAAAAGARERRQLVGERRRDWAMYPPVNSSDSHNASRHPWLSSYSRGYCAKTEGPGDCLCVAMAEVIADIDHRNGKR